jgi:hypothetical protein
MQLLLCIDVVANPKNSELFALCKWREGRRRDESPSLQGAIAKMMPAAGYTYAFPF